MTQRQAFHFIVTVWGDLYVRMFLDLCLPNQLTDGNLRAVARAGVDAQYLIYTTAKDRETILRDPRYRQVQALMPISVTAVADFSESRNSSHSLSMMTACHQIALPRSARTGAHMVILPPDQVYSEGTFARLLQIARTGKRVVLVSSLRVRRETFRPAFEAAFTNDEGLTPAPPRALVDLGLRHLHPMTLSYFADARPCSDDTTTLLYPVGDEGVVNSSLVSHPLMIRPRVVDAMPTTVFDVDYPIKACPSVGDYYLVRDSDEFMAFELSPSDKADNIPPVARGFNIYRHTDQAANYYNRIHRRLSRTLVRIHRGDTGPGWAAAEERARRNVFAMRLLTITSRHQRRYPHLFDPRRNLGLSTFTDLSHVSRVVVFGTGAASDLTRQLARACGWTIVCYADNDADRWGTLRDGLEIVEPASLSGREFDLIIVASERGQPAIFAQLERMGWRHRVHFIFFREGVTVNGLQLSIAGGG